MTKASTLATPLPLGCLALRLDGPWVRPGPRRWPQSLGHALLGLQITNVLVRHPVCFDAILFMLYETGRSSALKQWDSAAARALLPRIDLSSGRLFTCRWGPCWINPHWAAGCTHCFAFALRMSCTPGTFCTRTGPYCWSTSHFAQAVPLGGMWQLCPHRQTAWSLVALATSGQQLQSLAPSPPGAAWGLAWVLSHSSKASGMLYIPSLRGLGTTSYADAAAAAAPCPLAAATSRSYNLSASV